MRAFCSLVPACDPDVSPLVTIALEDQLRDPELKLIISALQGDRRIPKASRERAADKYRLDDVGLFRIVLRDGEPGSAVVVPRAMRAAILARHHYAPIDGAGHTGGERMYQQIRVNYYWPDMEDECHETKRDVLYDVLYFRG